MYSLMNARLPFPSAPGPTVGALIMDTWDWRAIFLALGILALLMLGLALPKCHETRRVKLPFAPKMKEGRFCQFRTRKQAALISQSAS